MSEIILDKIDISVEEPPFDERVLLFGEYVISQAFNQKEGNYREVTVKEVFIGHKHSITSTGPKFLFESFSSRSVKNVTHWARLPKHE